MQNYHNDLSANQKALLQLLTAAIHGESVKNLPLEIDWEVIFNESINQTVSILALDGAAACKDQIPKDILQSWFELATKKMSAGMHVMRSQQNMVHIMEKNHFSYFILKGAVSASYYPKPHLRSFGDVDFLIDPVQQEEVEEQLVLAGYKRWHHEHDYHVVFSKKGEHLEMHFEILGIPFDPVGSKIRDFVSDAVEHYQICTQDGFSFRAPEPLYHGLTLLLHTQHHLLGEGVGLRHLCDWGCFVKQTITQDFWLDSFLPFLKEIGLFIFAQIMTKTCALYLHTPCPDWCSDASDNLCYQLIQDIFDGGNFGRKNMRRSQATMLISRQGKNGTNQCVFRNMLHTMDRTIRFKYPIIKKMPFLYVFFFLYRSVCFLFNRITGRRILITTLLADAKKRRAFYKQLHIFEINS
ncbi:MAG: nucleotidyltransferase family protein [Clostridia bacterium]|nr:nucleotidyltransferase family protein [Clostridia bacterium]